MFRIGFNRLFAAGRTLVNDAKKGTTFRRAFATRPTRTAKFPVFVPPVMLLNFSLMKFFTKDDGETPEDKLIMTIKRAILSVQRDEFEKAER